MDSDIKKNFLDKYGMFITILIIILVSSFVYYKNYYNIIPTTKPTTKYTTKPTTKYTIKPTTPIPTTPIPTIPTIPTTPIPTTSIPTTTPPIIYTSPPLSQLESSIIGIWDSYIIGGTEYGPVTIDKTGPNEFSISVTNPLNNAYKFLTVNPNTKEFNLPNLYDRYLGNAINAYGRPIKIGCQLSGNGVCLSRPAVPYSSIPTQTNSVYKNPFEGIWSSYGILDKEYGPVRLTYENNGLFNISGDKFNDNEYYIKKLHVDPSTLLCTLPLMNSNNIIGTAIIKDGIAIKTVGSDIKKYLKR
jgi:hypothetical protein